MGVENLEFFRDCDRSTMQPQASRAGLQRTPTSKPRCTTQAFIGVETHLSVYGKPRPASLCSKSPAKNLGTCYHRVGTTSAGRKAEPARPNWLTPLRTELCGVHKTHTDARNNSRFNHLVETNQLFTQDVRTIYSRGIFDG